MLTRSTDQLGFSSHLEERIFFYQGSSLFTQCQGNDLHYKIDYNGVSFVISSFETVDILMNVKMLYHVVGIYPLLERSFNCKRRL